MRCLADNSLGQAAKVLLPLGVLGTGLMRPGHCLSGDICNHADHLISEAGRVSGCKCIMPRPATSSQGGGMLIEPHDGGEPPIHVLEGKGKRRPCLPFPRLGTGMFRGPGPSEFCL